MPRYIDADMLWDKISRAYQFEDKRGVLGYVKQCLNEAPIANVQEVRREYVCNWNIPIIKIYTFCSVNKIKVNCGSEKCPAWNYENCGDCYFHIKSPCDWNWNVIKHIIEPD